MSDRISIVVAATLICFVFLIPPWEIALSNELGPVDIHGFISQGYLKTNKNNFLAETEDGSFQFNEFGINFSTNPTEKLLIGVQLFARDLGKEGNDQIELDWAYADYRYRDWLGLRAGKIKTNLLLYGGTRDIDLSRTSIFLPHGNYLETARDSLTNNKGISFYGSLKMASLGRLFYEFYMAQLNFSDDNGFAAIFEDLFSVINLDINESSIDSTPLIVFDWHPPIEGLRIKLDFYKLKNIKLSGEGDFIPYYKFVADIEGAQFSIQYATRNFVIDYEFSKVNTYGQWDIGIGMEKLDPQYSEAWYIGLTVTLTDKLDLGASYAEFVPSTNHKKGTEPFQRVERKNFDFVFGPGGAQKIKHTQRFEAWLKTITGSIRYDINDNWIAKFEIAYNDGFGAYTSAENPDGELSRYWILYAAKLTFTF